ncbi:MAG TPA: hypothetical protein VGK87_14460 [Anaerolineae bacterium]
MLIIEKAILKTVAYADVFDYPLNTDEIHWYLWGTGATRQQVESVLQQSNTLACLLSYVETGDTQRGCGYYTLPGREHTIELRQDRERHASLLWLKARRYARLMSQMPFVRMLALTGSLSMGNVEPGADIDYLVVTAPGRLWLCRAAIIALTMWVGRRGDVICPNYFLSEHALTLTDRNLYTAHEFAQMVPLHGMDIYLRMQQNNAWVQSYLPNAVARPPLTGRIVANQPFEHAIPQADGAFKRAAEALLRTAPGALAERWEMRRKLRKFDDRQAQNPESNFGPDCCKGHFNYHRTRTMELLSQRLRALELQSQERQQAQAQPVYSHA